jgi:hypothetical protein
MGSKDPLFTLPACAHTMVGPSHVARTAGSAEAIMRPCASAGTRLTVRAPSPAMRSAVSMVACASSPATTCTRGAPCRPSCSTSHPARWSTAWRAMTIAVKFAGPPPVTNPTLVSAGRPNSSRSQPAATSSTTAAAGEVA